MTSTRSASLPRIRRFATEFGKLATANGVTIEQVKYKVDDERPAGLQPVEMEANLAGNLHFAGKVYQCAGTRRHVFHHQQRHPGGGAARPGEAGREARDIFEGGIVVQLGLENKKQTMWAAALGVVAILVLAYEFMPSSSRSLYDSLDERDGPRRPRRILHVR